MSLEHAILGFLSEREQSGYDLKTRCFDSEAAHYWTADQAQIYRTLERLSAREWVTSRSIPQRGKPDRRVYRITPAGRQALADWLASPQEPPPLRDTLLMQLRFSASLPPSTITETLRSTRAEYQARLDGLRETLTQHARAHRTPSREDEFVRLTIEAAVSSARFEIDRIDDWIEFLRAEEDALETGSPQRQLFGLPSEPGGAT